MTSRPFDDEEYLLRELKAAYAESRQVPPEAAQTAKASFTWRLVDAELETLSLCFDSTVDDLAVVRSGSTTAPRMLSFESDDIGVELEVGAHEVTGQLIPAQSGEVRFVSAAGPSAHTTADSNGCFVFRSPAQPPFRLEFRTPQAHFATEWIAR
jgi:hypothetical protein